MLFIFTVNYVQAQIDFSYVTNLLDKLFQDGSTYKGQKKENRIHGWGILKDDGSYILGRMINDRLKVGMVLNFSEKQIAILEMDKSITIYNQFGKIDITNSNVKNERKDIYRVGCLAQQRTLGSTNPSLFFGEFFIREGGFGEIPSNGIYFDLIDETITFFSFPSGICFENNNNWYVFDYGLGGNRTITERSSSSSQDWGQALTNIAVVLGGIYGLAKLGEYIDNSISGSSSSSPSSTNSSSNQSSDKDETDLYVLAVGVAQYANSNSNINTPDDDATDIANRLKRGENTSGLFNKVYTRVLTNSNATKSNILSALNWIKQNANKNDRFIIIYSSHGRMSGKEYHLSTYESSINIDELIQGINCDGCQTAIWLDACYSGGASAEFRNNYDNYIQQKKKPSIDVLMSSSDKEYSWTGRTHGLFAQAILDGLNGAADQNNNRIVSLRELVDYVKRIVPKYAGNYKKCPPENTKSPCDCCTQQPQHFSDDPFQTRLSKY